MAPMGALKLQLSEILGVTASHSLTDPYRIYDCKKLLHKPLKKGGAMNSLSIPYKRNGDKIAV